MRSLGKLQALPRLDRVVVQGEYVLLIDASCSACNSWAQFLCTRSSPERLSFASVDSAAGASLRAEAPSARFILKGRDTTYVNSEAVLRALGLCTSPVRWLSTATLVPRSLSDFCLAVISTFLAWRKKNKPCTQPSRQVQARTVL